MKKKTTKLLKKQVIKSKPDKTGWKVSVVIISVICCNVNPMSTFMPTSGAVVTGLVPDTVVVSVPGFTCTRTSTTKMMWKIAMILPFLEKRMQQIARM